MRNCTWSGYSWRPALELLFSWPVQPAPSCCLWGQPLHGCSLLQRIVLNKGSYLTQKSLGGSALLQKQPAAGREWTGGGRTKCWSNVSCAWGLWRGRSQGQQLLRWGFLAERYSDGSAQGEVKELLEGDRMGGESRVVNKRHSTGKCQKIQRTQPVGGTKIRSLWR